jgi:hypothetical protein
MHATAKLTCPSLLLQRGIICNSWHSTRRMCGCPTRTYCHILMLLLMSSHIMCTSTAIAVHCASNSIQNCFTVLGSRSDLLRLETIIQRHALHNTEQPAQHALRCGTDAQSDAACCWSTPTILLLMTTSGSAAVLMCLAGRRLLLAYMQRFPATQLCHFPAGVLTLLQVSSKRHG